MATISSVNVHARTNDDFKIWTSADPSSSTVTLDLGDLNVFFDDLGHARRMLTHALEEVVRAIDEQARVVNEQMGRATYYLYDATDQPIAGPFIGQDEAYAAKTRTPRAVYWSSTGSRSETTDEPIQGG